MVVAVQQPSVECTASFTEFIVEQTPTPCAVAIHKTFIDQQWNGLQDSACIYDQ